MPLPSGTRLGPYEVVAPLGAGGMGEVYRARDARLARDVAIKVLPASFSRDPERLRRLEQEAKATGSLNHPNIMAIHDTGDQEGTSYVVYELLSGQTLRERLAGSALPPRKALEIAAQIARGLAAAHDKGIVHRDLKPENVFVGDDGHVKILDFGLARIVETPGDESQSPTQSRVTDPGVVLGTVGYMSPEQVRGAVVDHRSDIFSLGTILYEMLTGRRAFKKETAAETMAAILREDPPELVQANAALPLALERVVSHCLEKNPQERFASARDLAFDLDSLSDMSATGARALRPANKGRRVAWMVAGWLVSLSLVGASAYMLGRGDAAPPPTRYQQLTFGRGRVTGAAFSPDGASVVYSATWNGAASRVFSMRLDLQREQPLDIEGTVVGAAAGELAFLRDDGTLLRVPLTGGGSREVAKDVRAADWSKDGTRFAVARRVGARGVLEFPIGTVASESVGDFLRLRISPDASRVAVVERPSAGVAGGFVTVVGKDGARRLTTDAETIPTSLAWSPDGNEVWFTADERGDYSVYAVSLSGRRRLLAKSPQEPRLWTVFGDGRTLMTLGQTRREVAGLFPGTSVERDLTLRGFSQSWDISADGRRYVIADDMGHNVVSTFVGSTDDSPLVRIGEGIPNSLSPDGGSVVVWNDTGGVGTALAVLLTGAGQARDVPRGTIAAYLDARFLPDGRLLLSASEAGRPRRMFVQQLPEGLPKHITPEGVFTEYAFSTPDGAFVPAGSNYEEAPYSLYPIAGGEPRPIPGLEKGDQPIRFSADGRRLFVRHGYAADNTKARIAVLDLATGRKQPWRVVGPADPAGVDDLQFLIPSADGSAYVYTYDRLLSNLFLVQRLR